MCFSHFTINWLLCTCDSVPIHWSLCFVRWLYVTEDDIKGLPCFQVLFRQYNMSQFHLCVSKERHFGYLFIIIILIMSNCWSLLQNETLIAIKAPHGTTLEVPDPDEVRNQIRIITLYLHFNHSSISFFSHCIEQAVDYPQRRYRIILRSTMGHIDVYLVR